MATTQKLLTPTQVTKCKKIAAGETEFSQRAAVLLAIHHGASQAVAASETGLTIGQVRYWVAKFRRLAMAAFPQTPAAETSTKSVNVATAKPAKKAKSKTKGKKNPKDEKKIKKDKKGKKEKSVKKTKKKAKDKKKNKKK